MKAISQRTALRITAIVGALAVGLGAFGAHGLKDVLLENDRLDTWETAAFYHLVHAVVLLVLATRKTWSSGPWFLMTIGILIFSGSLYMLCLTNVGWLGAITPIGGVCLIVGWVWTGFSKLAH